MPLILRNHHAGHLSHHLTHHLTHHLPHLPHLAHLAHLAAHLVTRWEETFPAIPEGGEPSPRVALEMYRGVGLYLAYLGGQGGPGDQGDPGGLGGLERMARYLVASLDSDSPKASYIGVFLSKAHSVAWIGQVKALAALVSSSLPLLSTDSPSYSRRSATLVLLLLSFTSTSTWRLLKAPALAALAPHMTAVAHTVAGHLVAEGLLPSLRQLLVSGLGSARPALRRSTLAAVLALALRPVQYAAYSPPLVSQYLVSVLSVPGLLQHAAALCPEALGALHAPAPAPSLWSTAIDLLAQDQQLRIHFNALEGSYALCLTANLVHLLAVAGEVGERLVVTVGVLTSLLASCSQYVTAKQSNLSHWHPVLGWFSVSLDRHLQASMGQVKAQLARLWAPDTVRLLTAHLSAAAAALPPLPPPPSPPAAETSLGKKLVKQVVEKTRVTVAATSQAVSPSSPHRLGDPACTKVALVCTLYQTAIKTLSQLRIDILNGLCFGDLLLRPLWLFLNSLGPTCGIKSFLELLASNRAATAPEFQMLVLFCDTCSHLVTMLDDQEFYDTEQPFARHEFATLGTFLNTFLYRAIWSGLVTAPDLPLYQSLSGLLGVLRRRDGRRAFCKPGHWLVKELRLGPLLGDLEKKKAPARLLLQAMPHVLPHQERVLLFRKRVGEEKASLGIGEHDSSPHSTLISVHRNRVVEDGYRQLAGLSSAAMKGVIRVRFVNRQGLDEAGIDQDGVFKEFLEETVKAVFDPGLNLFATTSEERLYPSPTSHLTDNHLDLFEFVGRVIGKAVFEGIVVDVPFASFFLTQVLGHDHSALYSYLDEMPSSDPELHKNLTYVKHYEGDVEDLGLTFSFDQDVLGRLVTHELVPGGRGVNVTNTNRISYIHHMAHFKMHRQIQAQVAAFRTGFRTLIPPDWLNLFSGPEVQRPPRFSPLTSPLD